MSNGEKIWENKRTTHISVSEVRTPISGAMVPPRLMAVIELEIKQDLEE